MTGFYCDSEMQGKASRSETQGLAPGRGAG